jgi:hypothetical protein
MRVGSQSFVVWVASQMKEEWTMRRMVEIEKYCLN